MRLAGDLAHRAALPQQGLEASEIDWRDGASQPNAPGPRARHTGLDPLADNVALELGHGADDGEHGLSDGRGGIELLLEGDEADVETAEHLQRRDQVLHRPGEAIEAPDEDHLALAGPGGLHEPVERRPALLGARDAAVDELLDHPPTPLGGVGTQGSQLDLWILVVGGDPGVEAHRRRHGALDLAWPACLDGPGEAASEGLAEDFDRLRAVTPRCVSETACGRRSVARPAAITSVRFTRVTKRAPQLFACPVRC